MRVSNKLHEEFTVPVGELGVGQAFLISDDEEEGPNCCGIVIDPNSGNIKTIVRGTAKAPDVLIVNIGHAGYSNPTLGYLSADEEVLPVELECVLTDTDY